MKNKLKIELLSLLENKHFVQSVRESGNSDDLLDELLKKYPDSKNEILSAFEFIRLSLSEKKKLSEDEFKAMLGTITEYSKAREIKKGTVRKFFIQYLWKAAILLILFSAGTLLVYYQLKRDPLDQFAQTNTKANDQAMIVLSDGSERLLKDNDLYIDYESSDGEIVVKNANKEEERIRNSGKSGRQVLNQVVVPFGQTHTVSLSDGTVVQLNAGSKLTFSPVFSGKKREVYLMGQAFFKVTRNETMPFVVRTEHISVEVLGTTFDISAYNDENFASAILVEGSVRVSQKNRPILNDEYILKQGQGCFYNIDKEKSVVKDVEVEQYISWKDGLFIFKDMTLMNVVKRLKRYYNKSIQIKDVAFSNTLVSGKLVLSGDFMDVLKYVSKTVEGEIQEENDGSYVITANHKNIY